MESIRECIRECVDDFLRDNLRDGLREYVKYNLKDDIKELERVSQELGMKEGKNAERKYIILNMIKNNMKIEEIKKYTGVSEKEIEKIAANM